jgi:Peptidase S24-like
MSVLAKNLLKLDSPTNAPHSIWSAERSALVADVLSTQVGSSRTLRLQVRGESMLPTLWPGDTVDIENCSIDAVQPGEVVLALRDGRLFLHRLSARRTAVGFQLRGDSMPAPDPLFPPEALIGRMVADSRTGRIPLGFRTKISQTIGLILCHCAPARRLALKLHQRRKRSPGWFTNSESAAELEIL